MRIFKQYSFAVILRDLIPKITCVKFVEIIPYLEDVNVVSLDMTTDIAYTCYIFKIDESACDLQI